MLETASHEAGHAVIAHHLGRKVVSISIAPGISDDGLAWPALTTHAPWPETLDPRIRGERDIMISFAGGIAQEPYAEGPDSVVGSAENDLVRARRRAKALWPDPEEAKKQLDRLFAEARRLVDQHWDEINRVAYILLLRETLSGEEFVEALTRPLPAQMKP